MSLFLLKREKELPDIQENDDELYRSIHAGVEIGTEATRPDIMERNTIIFW